MLKHRPLTQNRIALLVDAFAQKFWKAKMPLAPRVSDRVDRISYDEAMKLKFLPVPALHEFGPRFSTYWFRVEGEIPKAWQQGTVDLIFNTQSECTVWMDGIPRQGINPTSETQGDYSNRFDFRLPAEVVRHGRVDLAVEMSCNRLFGYDGPPSFRLHEASLAWFDDEAWKLYHDLVVPWRILDARPDKSRVTPLEGLLLARLNSICNVVDPEDRSTWANARPLLDEIYSLKNGTLALELSAIGHAHIDTAWLWPLAETKRKCIRSFSTALKYMEEYPEYKFSCSQAFQYQWMKDHAPSIFRDIQAAVKRGQWIPVGGTWVEPDCNIPSGESLVRQFFYGKRFFRDEFGWDCKEFWNPDVFGYTGQLPQIMKLAGIDYFLTQKLSWNQFNKPDHQNFLWKGIDGTGVLTHFPPSDTYNAMDGENALLSLLHAQKNHQDLDRTHEGMMLFGWGDGGGGPTRHMLEILRRSRDIQGLPRTEQRSSLEFFERLERSLVDMPVREGELYFEYHRGTYTTHAANKRDNRASELALRRVELLEVIAANRGASYPAEQIERLWKIVLLNQFHDILPGSSIHEVYEDSSRDYAEVLASTAALQTQSLRFLAGRKKKGVSVFNSLGWERTELVQLDSPCEGSQEAWNGKHLATVCVAGLAGAKIGTGSSSPERASITSSRAGFVMENDHVRVELSREGRLISMLHKRSGRESLAPGEEGNRFVMFDDRPNAFDAWDVDAFHLETRRELSGAIRASVIESGPLRAGVSFEYQFGPTTLKQHVFLQGGAGYLEFDTEVDWQHRRKFLKVEFPVAVRARHAAYEMPFGVAWRPTTFNNSFEMAQFEVPGHRWMDFSEEGFGTALFTDSKYGYACHENVLRLSLLRGPNYPDPAADLGHHRFRYALYPHSGSLVDGAVVRLAHAFNDPLLPVAGEFSVGTLFSVDSPHIIIDTVKQAANSQDVIVRIYECHGARGDVTLQAGFSVQTALRTNLLEEPIEHLSVEGNRMNLAFRPYEILTLRLILARAG